MKSNEQKRHLEVKEVTEILLLDFSCKNPAFTRNNLPLAGEYISGPHRLEA
jgi:hypothetical protein